MPKSHKIYFLAEVDALFQIDNAQKNGWQEKRGLRKYMLTQENKTYTCVFFSRLLAEVVCRLLNQQGNNYNVMEATPELLLTGTDATVREDRNKQFTLSTLPTDENRLFAVFLGVANDLSGKIVFGEDKTPMVAGMLLLTKEEEKNYLETGAVPSSWLDKIKTLLPEGYMDNCLMDSNKTIDDLEEDIALYVKNFQNNQVTYSEDVHLNGVFIA